VAGPNASVGSIGVYTALQDWSGLYAREGVKVHVVRAGRFKGMGTAGTEVTAEQLTELQREVDEINAQFVGAVARGRRMTDEAAMELADGRIHRANAAKEMKLIDAVQTFDAAMSEMRGKVQTKTKAGARASATGAIQEIVMADETKDVKPVAEAPKAATIGEIKAAIPDAEPGKIIGWLEKSFTLAQCKDAHMDHLRVEVLAATAAAQKAESALKKPGLDPVKDVGGSSASSSGGDAINEWNAALDEKIKGGMSREKAARQLAKEKPELRQAMIVAWNDPARLRMVG